MKNKVLSRYSIIFSVLSIITFFALCSKSTAVQAEESEFEQIAKNTDLIIEQAISQFKKEDYSALKKPDKYPKLRIDLFNAWDKEKNKVSMHTYTGYDDAQSWKLTQNSDGTYSIRTPYKSGRAITIDKEGSNAYISTTSGEPSDSQKWNIIKIE